MGSNACVCSMVPRLILCCVLLTFPLNTLGFRHRPRQIRVQAVTPPINHAEGPHFDYENQILLYVDQYEKQVCIYNLQTRLTRCTLLDHEVGPIVPIQDSQNQYLLGLGLYLVVLDWDGESRESKYTILRRVEADKPKNRFNDGKADKFGRFWLGTIGEQSANGDVVPNQGNLYHYTKRTCSLAIDVPNVSISNGIAWSRDSTTMFYIDSATYLVYSYDYDIQMGAISNRRTVFDFKANNVAGLPDGMTIDTEDNLWIACNEGSQVIQVNPRSGERIRTIRLPVSRVTSLAWGGYNLDILFVTTSRRLLSTEELAQQPYAGSVLAITGLPARGWPANNAVVCRQAQANDYSTGRQPTTQAQACNANTSQVQQKRAVVNTEEESQVQQERGPVNPMEESQIQQEREPDNTAEESQEPVPANNAEGSQVQQEREPVNPEAESQAQQEQQAENTAEESQEPVPANNAEGSQVQQEREPVNPEAESQAQQEQQAENTAEESQEPVLANNADGSQVQQEREPANNTGRSPVGQTPAGNTARGPHFGQSQTSNNAGRSPFRPQASNAGRSPVGQTLAENTARGQQVNQSRTSNNAGTPQAPPRNTPQRDRRLNRKRRQTPRMDSSLIRKGKLSTRM